MIIPPQHWNNEHKANLLTIYLYVLIYPFKVTGHIQQMTTKQTKPMKSYLCIPALRDAEYLQSELGTLG